MYTETKKTNQQILFNDVNNRRLKTSTKHNDHS
jgi:hypothetical protein